LLILKSEDFFTDKRAVLERALDFLGLPRFELKIETPRSAGEYAPMHPDTRRCLQEFFVPHNQKLYDLLSMDFSW
jgi:hypothetical protein